MGPRPAEAQGPVAWRAMAAPVAELAERAEATQAHRVQGGPLALLAPAVALGVTPGPLAAEATRAPLGQVATQALLDPAEATRALRVAPGLLAPEATRAPRDLAEAAQEPLVQVAWQVPAERVVALRPRAPRKARTAAPSQMDAALRCLVEPAWDFKPVQEVGSTTSVGAIPNR